MAGAACHAQALCQSDGRPAPRALLERFVPADCAECWTDTRTPAAAPQDLALDWVVPSPRGDEAALSAVARIDATWRAQALRMDGQRASQMRRVRLPQQRQALRVAHGLAFNGYLGVSLRVDAAELGPPPWRVHLALIERLPSGTENSPVARNLVRNGHERSWDGHTLLLKSLQLKDSLVMAVPDGARPERLALVGWLEDRNARVRAIAVADCLDDPRPN